MTSYHSSRPSHTPQSFLQDSKPRISHHHDVLHRFFSCSCKPGTCHPNRFSRQAIWSYLVGGQARGHSVRRQGPSQILRTYLQSLTKAVRRPDRQCPRLTHRRPTIPRTVVRHLSTLQTISPNISLVRTCTSQASPLSTWAQSPASSHTQLQTSSRLK